MVIKYKCWDFFKNTWHVPAADDGVSILVQEGVTTRLISPSNYEFVLFTGIEDKNGNEIYAGDVFDEKYYLYWSQYRKSWSLFTPEGKDIGLEKFDPMRMTVTDTVFNKHDWVRINADIV